MSLTINSTPQQDNLQFELVGDLDINTSPELKAKVLDEYREDSKDIVFNFEQLEYLDSTGLGVFISIFKNIQENGHTLTIKNAKPNVKKLFTITQLDQIFTIES